MKLKGKRILITGAAGFIGRHAVERCVKLGMKVKGWDMAPDPFHSKGVQYIQGDIGDARVRQAACRDADIVLNTAAIVSESGDWKEFRRVNVESAVLLAQEAARAGAAQFVQLSSVMVYGFDYPHMVTESGPFSGQNNPYCQTKIEGELALLQLHEPRRFDVIVIRPGDVYGPGSMPWVVRPLQMMKRHQFVLPGGGAGTMNHVHIENLLDAIFLAADKNVSGRAINVTDGQQTSWKKYFSLLAEAGGLPRPPSVPVPLARAAATLISGGARLFGVKSQLNPAAVDFVLRAHPVSIDRARTLLGYKPRITLAHGMVELKGWIERSNI